MINCKQNFETTDEQWLECHAIIHAASTLAAGAGAGMAPVPMPDAAIIIPIQVGMIISLGRVFGIELTESTAQALATANLAAITGKTLVKLLTGWIPGIGSIINAGTAATLTESLGWLIVDDFRKRPAWIC